jgi:hypothetical protein
MLGYAFIDNAHSNPFKTIPNTVYPPPAIPKLVMVPMATTNLFGEPAFKDGAFMASDPRMRIYEGGRLAYERRDQLTVELLLGVR